MPKTSREEETAKINPYVITKINKALLTPCRRVGLSKIKKTPVGSNNSSSESSPGNTSAQSVLDITPTIQPAIDSPYKTETAKINAHVTPVINKTLLTPCRRVGLPKVKKTSVSLNGSFSENSSLNTSVQSVLSTTPTLDITSESSTVQLNNNNETFDYKFEQSQVKKSKRKTKVSKRLIADDDDAVEVMHNHKFNKKKRMSSEEENQGIEEIDLFEDSTKNVISSVDDQKSSRAAQDKAKQKERSKSKKSLRKNKKSPNTEAFIDNTDKRKIEKENTDIGAKHGTGTYQECTINMQINLEKNENVLKPKLYNQINDDIEDIEKLGKKYDKHEKKITEAVTEIDRRDKKNHEQVQENSTPVQDVKLNSENVSKAHSPKKTKKIKRCLSMKKTSSDDKGNSHEENLIFSESVVSLTPLEEKINDVTCTINISPKDIISLEKQIEEKQKLLRELQQAEIYKKKHDLKELEELTSTWKKGCIAALNDLLQELQPYTEIPMDMATLLKNLHVSEKLITLTKDGDLV